MGIPSSAILINCISFGQMECQYLVGKILYTFITCKLFLKIYRPWSVSTTHNMLKLSIIYFRSGLIPLDILRNTPHIALWRSLCRRLLQWKPFKSLNLPVVWRWRRMHSVSAWTAYWTSGLMFRWWLRIGHLPLPKSWPMNVPIFRINSIFGTFAKVSCLRYCTINVGDIFTNCTITTFKIE